MPSLIFTAVAVALAAVFACLAIVSSRKSAACLRQTIEIASALRSVRGKVEAHDAELDAVTDTLRQLRGKFYAERRKSLPPEEPQADPADVASLKNQLRRKVGLVAGRPAPHRSEST